MADNHNTHRDVPETVADDDPFAELARIMSREQQAAAPMQPADATGAETQHEGGAPDPLAIDLEQELLGDADLGNEADFGPDAAPAPAGWDDGHVSAEEDDGAEAFAAEAHGDPFDDDPTADIDSHPAVDATDGHEYEGTDEPFGATGPDLPVAQDHARDHSIEAQPRDYWTGPAAGGVEHAPDVETAEWQPDAGRADDPGTALADVDMDFGDLDISVSETPPPALATSESEAAPAPAAAHDDDAASRISLEDELEILLADRAAPEAIASPAVETVPAGDNDSAAMLDEVDEGFPEPAHPRQPAAFGRANFAGTQPSWGAQADIPAADISEPDQPYDDEPVPDAGQEDPFAALAAIAPHEEPSPAFGDDVEQAAADAAPMDFETVDVPEPALAQPDDLDLPDLPDETRPAAPVDEFGSDFEFDFASADTDGIRPPQPDNKPVPADDEALFYAEALGFGAAGAVDGQFAASARPSAHEPRDADLGRDMEDALLHDETFAATPDEAPARRNGFMIAGAVLAVALLGGIGAFALSFGGGDAEEPVLVQADDEPMKVKPDDPGGSAAVPNQDSVAYDAATGGAGGGAPQQESLVSATEEPVNIASRAVDATRLPGVDEDLAEPAASAAGKAEDRLEAAASQASAEIADDVIAVQPRRVRTMIVRPDGTLVPREEANPETPAPEAAAATPPADPQPTPIAEPQPAAPEPQSAAAEPQPLPAVSNSTAAPEAAAPVQQEAPASARQDIAVLADPVTPQTAPVAPARPANQDTGQSQQVAQAAAPRPQPAAPAAAASSEWSVQIASQPSADSAQATYQDLARRYGNLLDGRGVNIVRAEIPGKGTYYRVRIPTSSRNDGIQLCERYKAAGGSCFVSK